MIEGGGLEGALDGGSGTRIGTTRGTEMEAGASGNCETAGTDARGRGDKGRVGVRIYGGVVKEIGGG
jgi:hypothetical protein